VSDDAQHVMVLAFWRHLCCREATLARVPYLRPIKCVHLNRILPFLTNQERSHPFLSSRFWSLHEELRPNARREYSAPMIWRDDDDKRGEQQRKIEYARELEQQIELRKALEREQQQQQEEWERRFVEPRDARSPAKWWTELRASEPPARAARLGFHMDASALPNADPAMESGAPSLPSGTVARQRFHTTLGDPLASHDRLREKAQQIEWKRVLDEQLREKERRKQFEAEQKWLRERDEAQEEMRIQREQHLRAQRKLGIHDAFTPQNYVAIPSPPAPRRQPDPSNTDDDLRDGYTGIDPRSAQPPPAPVQTRGMDSVDVQFRRAMGLQDPLSPLHETARDSIANEYRALLAEIRRERQELRRERDELRREKEELRMERALMQMENEKMATLLESQRHMTDQRLESNARLDRALETRAPPVVDEPPVTPRYARPQTTTSRRPTQLPSPLHVVHRDHSVRPQQPSPVQGGAMSMADFAPPSSSNLRSPSSRAIDALLARRHERFRLREEENPLERSLNGESEFVALSPHAAGGLRQYGAAPRITETRSPSASAMDPRRERANPLRNSRVIKSRGFYDLNREDAQPQPRQQQQQRTVEDHHSPVRTRSGRRAETSSEDESGHSDEEEERAQPRTRRPSKYSDDGSHDYDQDDQDGDEDEVEEEDLPVLGDNLMNASQSEFGLSRSLFQVQVLVKEQA
jgi:hypothetical protein